jgi:hypothetical protein
MLAEDNRKSLEREIEDTKDESIPNIDEEYDRLVDEQF